MHKPLAGGDEARDGALHIRRAAPVQIIAVNRGGERGMSPERFIAGRHHIGMPGEDHQRRVRAPGRPEIADITYGQ